MATIEGKDSKEWFREAAQRQKRSNKFARYEPPKPSQPQPQQARPAQSVAALPTKPKDSPAPVKKPEPAAAKPAPAPTTVAKPEAPKPEKKPWEKLLKESIKGEEEREKRIKDLDRRAVAENKRFDEDEQAKAAKRKLRAKEISESRSPIAKAIGASVEGTVGLARILEKERKKAAAFTKEAGEKAKSSARYLAYGDEERRKRATGG
jgi:outer membrane biosynthesis protein TonB